MKSQINFRASDETIRQIAALAAVWNDSQTNVITRAIERAYQEIGMNTVKITQTGIRCPRHGIVPGAEYRAADPAPCGCAWVWEGGRLMAVPSMSNFELDFVSDVAAATSAKGN